MATQAVSIEDAKTGETTEAVYEHPFAVRLCHWINAVALFVMVGSGLQIFRAFPSFGAKIPQKDLLHWPKAFAIGGWLGGALQWHLTFMWIYMATGLIYLGYQLFSGNYKQVLFVPRDIPGVWPMVRHYFFFGPKPPLKESYNPLQKHAYTSVIVLGVLSVLMGLVATMARAAVAAGADGLIIEVHQDPDRALSDGMQSLDLPGFAQLMREVEAVARAIGRPLHRIRA